jgi:hypothetical protein
MVAQLVKKFPAIHGTRAFIFAWMVAHHRLERSDRMFSLFQPSSCEILAGLPAKLFQVSYGFPQFLQANVRMLLTSEETGDFLSKLVFTKQYIFQPNRRDAHNRRNQTTVYEQ